VRIKIKTSILIFALILSGCYIPTPEILIPTPKFDTELNCPRENYKIVLLESTPADIRKAINKAVQDRNEFKTTENYTVLKLPNKKTFFIQNITPEKMEFCYLIAIPIGSPPPDVTKIEFR
jgi:hypothetical protein